MDSWMCQDPKVRADKIWYKKGTTVVLCNDNLIVLPKHWGPKTISSLDSWFTRMLFSCWSNHDKASYTQGHLQPIKAVFTPQMLFQSNFGSLHLDRCRTNQSHLNKRSRLLVIVSWQYPKMLSKNDTHEAVVYEWGCQVWPSHVWTLIWNISSVSEHGNGL